MARRSATSSAKASDGTRKAAMASSHVRKNTSSGRAIESDRDCEPARCFERGEPALMRVPAPRE